MSKKTRYDFAKQLYFDYVVLIKYKDRYVTYGADKSLIDYIGFYGDNGKYKFKVFSKYGINYLVLDDLEIIDLNKFENNNYDKYVYIVNLKIVINKIGNRLIKS